MIAIAENSSRAVCVFGRMSSYLSGREPLDFSTGNPDTDAALAEIGYVRTAEWATEKINGTTVYSAAVKRTS